MSYAIEVGGKGFDTVRVEALESGDVEMSIVDAAGNAVGEIVLDLIAIVRLRAALELVHAEAADAQAVEQLP